VERVHLFALAGRTLAAEHTEPLDEVRPGLLRLLAAIEPLPACVIGPSLDLLAWNPTASLLFGGFERRSAEERNMARLVFLDPEVREILGSPECVGAGFVAGLRVLQATGRQNPRIDALVCELSEHSEEFRALWAEHVVVKRTHGQKAFDHPQVGKIDLDWDRLTVPGGSGQTLLLYSAEPGTPSATALTLLGTLAATVAQPS
jgi:hypothetical protein